MKCRMCRQRGKPWQGDDPRCAFDGDFDDNWMCATLNALRDICDEWKPKMPQGVAFQCCDDTKYATTRTDDIFRNGESIGLAFWLSWYKTRGHTNAVWLMTLSEPPRRPTEDECLAVIAAYDRQSDALLGRAGRFASTAMRRDS